MRTTMATSMFYLVIALSLQPSSSDQPLWLLYSKLMDNRELDHAKTFAATINID
jgi:hypothetical protein